MLFFDFKSFRHAIDCWRVLAKELVASFEILDSDNAPDLAKSGMIYISSIDVGLCVVVDFVSKSGIVGIDVNVFWKTKMFISYSFTSFL